MLLVKEIAELQAASETGTVNDKTYKWLGDQGYSGTINERIYAFLEDKGYEGTISDRIAKGIEGGVTETTYRTTFDNSLPNYIEVGTNISLSASSNYAVSARLQFNTGGGYIFAYDGSSNRNYRFGFDSSGMLFGLTQDSLGTVYIGDISEFLADGIVHEIYIEVTSTTCTVYIDGSLYSSTTSTFVSSIINVIGAPFSGSTSVPYYNGLISEFKVWTGGTKETGTLVLDYQMTDEYSSTSYTVTDSSGNGNDGTIINPYDGMSSLYAEGAKYDLIEV